MKKRRAHSHTHTRGRDHTKPLFFFVVIVVHVVVVAVAIWVDIVCCLPVKNALYNVHTFIYYYGCCCCCFWQTKLNMHVYFLSLISISFLHFWTMEKALGPFEMSIAWYFYKPYKRIRSIFVLFCNNSGSFFENALSAHLLLYTRICIFEMKAFLIVC